MSRFTHWLHVRGIIRITSSTSHSLDPTYTVRIETTRLVPARAVAWTGRRYVLHMRPSIASSHCLARIGRARAGLGGKRQWTLTYLPAPTTTSRPRDQRLLGRGRIAA